MQWLETTGSLHVHVHAKRNDSESLCILLVGYTSGRFSKWYGSNVQLLDRVHFADAERAGAQQGQTVRVESSAERTHELNLFEIDGRVDELLVCARYDGWTI